MSVLEWLQDKAHMKQNKNKKTANQPTTWSESNFIQKLDIRLFCVYFLVGQWDI